MFPACETAWVAILCSKKGFTGPKTLGATVCNCLQVSVESVSECSKCIEQKCQLKKCQLNVFANVCMCVYLFCVCVCVCVYVCVCVSVCVCVCVCVCVQLAIHTSMGSHPLAGDRAGGGEPCPTKLPHPPQASVPACLPMHLREGSSHFRAVSFPVSGTARARPAPLRIIFILFCRYALPGVWRAFGTKLSFTFIAQSVRMMVSHLSVSSDQDKSTCVCVCLCVARKSFHTCHVKILS